MLSIKNGRTLKPSSGERKKLTPRGCPWFTLRMLKRSQLHKDTIFFDKRTDLVGMIKSIDLSGGTLDILWSDMSTTKTTFSKIASGPLRHLRAVRVKDFPLSLEVNEEYLHGRLRSSTFKVDGDYCQFTRSLDVLSTTSLTADWVENNISSFLPNSDPEFPRAFRDFLEHPSSMSFAVGIQKDRTHGAIWKVRIQSVFLVSPEDANRLK